MLFGLLFYIDIFVWYFFKFDYLFFLYNLKTFILKYGFMIKYGISF